MKGGVPGGWETPEVPGRPRCWVLQLVRRYVECIIFVRQFEPDNGSVWLRLAHGVNLKLSASVAPRGGKGGKGYQGNKGWKSNKETSYVIDAGGDDEVHTCFVLNDSNPSSDAPTHVTISNSAMNLLLGKDDDDGEVELKTTQARGDMIAAHGRMGARSPQRRSYSILSSQPTPPPPHPHQFTTQSELWLVKVLRERRRRSEQPQQEEATRATTKEER